MMKYPKLVKEFVDDLKVELSGKWFWEIIDADTNFLVAAHSFWERIIEGALKLFKQAKESHLSLKGKTPTEACGINLKIKNG